MSRLRKNFGSFICGNPHCRQQFYGYRGNLNKYCSKRCTKRKYPAKKIACEGCGKLFISGVLNRKKFCSIQCAQPVHEQNCAVCEKSFNAGPSRRRKFCSRECFLVNRKQTAEERFWKKVNKSNDCWIWIGGKNRSGYGITCYNGKKILTHRAAYQFLKGSIPDKFLCLHKCDNPSCVNPQHLFVGTQQDNVKDMYEKGRGSKKRTGWVTKREWLQILDFYNHKCALCGSSDNLVKDHYISIASGGIQSWDNIWPLCRRCNWRKGDRLPTIKEPPHIHGLRDKINKPQRLGKWIYWRESRKRYEVQTPLVGKKYIGRYKTLKEARAVFNSVMSI